MTQKKSFNLSRDDFLQLGELWDGDFSPISPLYEPEGGSEEKMIPEIFQACGIVDKSGNIDEDFNTELGIIAKPSRIVRLSLMNADRENFATRYFSGEYPGCVTCIHGDDGSIAVGGDLKVSWLLTSYDLDKTAGSDAKPLSALLSPQEALVFLAICDLERELSLASKIPDYPSYIFENGFKSESVDAIIIGLTENPGFSIFSGGLNALAGENPDYDSADNQGILEILEQKGLLEKLESGYRLTEGLRNLPGEFLTQDVVFEIDLAISDGTNVEESSVYGSISGDLFYSLRTGESKDEVGIFWLGKAAATTLLEGILEDPSFDPATVLSGDLLITGKAVESKPKRKPKKTAKTEEKKEDQKTEQTEDTKAEPEPEITVKAKEQKKKQKTEPAEISKSEPPEKTETKAKKSKNFCTECGAPLKAGAKFCSQCGNKLN